MFLCSRIRSHAVDKDELVQPLLDTDMSQQTMGDLIK